MLNMSAVSLSKAIKEKKITVAEAVEAYLDAIDKNDKQLNAFITVAKDYARKRATVVQEQIDKGEDISPLAGVPIALKDNISTKDILTTCASKMLEDYVPVFSATVVERLEQAGMIVIGKLNMDEFGMGSSSETGLFGPVCNPWDTTRVAGGSSGGSAAAVAGGEVPLALASDTGGSIRQPCAFNGVTGIKPTYGSVSRHGAVAYASSLDQVGVIGWDINDCAALLSVISGPCEKDSTCIISKSFKFEPSQSEQLAGVKIGVMRSCFDDNVDSEVGEALNAAVREFEAAGAIVEEFDMPLAEYIAPVYHAIACAEVSSNLSKFDGFKYGHRSSAAKTLSEAYCLTRNEGFGMEVKKRMLAGALILSADYYEEFYVKALRARTLIKEAYNDLFKRFDMILSPVTTTTAYKLGESEKDPVKMQAEDVYNASVNLAGLPSVALPCGFAKGGLPIGFQLIGDSFSDEELIKAAQVYQNRTTHHTKRPGGGMA